MISKDELLQRLTNFSNNSQEWAVLRGEKPNQKEHTKATEDAYILISILPEDNNFCKNVIEILTELKSHIVSNRRYWQSLISECET